jgi:hypothetical protein
VEGNCKGMCIYVYGDKFSLLYKYVYTCFPRMYVCIHYYLYRCILVFLSDDELSVVGRIGWRAIARVCIFMYALFTYICIHLHSFSLLNVYIFIHINTFFSHFVDVHHIRSAINIHLPQDYIYVYIYIYIHVYSFQV